MQLCVLFTCLLPFLVATGTSIAAPQARSDITAREADVDGHIFICTDANFSGDCENYGFFNNQCSTFPAAFQDDITSAGPDKGWACTLYVNAGCDGSAGEYGVTYPGVAVFDSTYNDQFSSVKCSK